MSYDAKKDCQLKDVITMGPEIAPGVRPAVRHDADHNLSVGMLHKVEEGQPMPEGTLLLQKVEGSSYKVVREVTPTESQESRGGPAMVASDAYRTGWENLFGNKQTVGSA